MKKYVYILMLFLAVMSMIMLAASCNTTDEICVDKERSYFSGFEIERDRVYVKCYVTLVNTYDIEKTVTLSAKLPEDVAGGLVKNEEIKALNEEGEEMVFVLPPNASKAFDVVFVGEYSGTDQKHDRNLPEINIKIIK